MKEAEDTLIKATNIIAKAEAIRPVPATTPEMMEYYRQHLQLNHSNKDQLIGAGIVNGLLQPDYELRRFRDKKLGKDGILMPLTPKDWETLTDAYGPRAIEARFSPIHRHIKTAKGRRPTMDP